MLNDKIKTGIFILMLSVFLITDAGGEDLSLKPEERLISTQENDNKNDTKGRENYLLLKSAFDKWDSGLFGSRKYYRNRLNLLLSDMIGNDIVTARDFRISIPDVFEKRYYSSDLYNCNWLYIHGPADDSSIKMFAEKGNDYIKGVERNMDLFFLSGKVLKFRIGETSSGRYSYERSIHIYLESVKIRDSIK